MPVLPGVTDWFNVCQIQLYHIKFPQLFHYNPVLWFKAQVSGGLMFHKIK